jgi:hypothetical protein
VSESIPAAFGERITLMRLLALLLISVFSLASSSAFVGLIVFCSAVTSHAAVISVHSATDLIACAENPVSPNESTRVCLVESAVEGPFTLSLPLDAPPDLTIECSGAGRLTWASEKDRLYVADAFSVRIHPTTAADWRVTLKNCNVSDIGLAGTQTVQGPMLVNYGNVMGTFTLDGVTFTTLAFGLSSVGGWC